MEEEEFYIIEESDAVFEKPRKARFLRFLKGSICDDFALLHIDPPIIGQRYGFGGNDIEYVAVVPRHKGVNLRSRLEWPIFVHVFIFKKLNPLNCQRFSLDEWTNISWALLVRTLEEARK